MKRILFLTTLVLSLTLNCIAQPHGTRRPHMNNHGGPRPSFEQYMNEKTSFILSEMQLSSADSAKFVPMFKDLQVAKAELMRKYGSSRRVNASIRRNEPVADSLKVKAALDEAALQVEDAELEKQFLQKLSAEFPAEQVNLYTQAVRKFKDEVMKKRVQPRNSAN